MNLKKILMAAGLVSSFGLVACGGDSSSGSSPEDSSSSSSAVPIVLPEANGDSLLLISDFKPSYANATELRFNGSIGINWDADTAIFIDSVALLLGNNGLPIEANFTMETVDYSQKQSLSIGKELRPAVDLMSFADCGTLVAYLIVYAHNDAMQIVAKDSTTFKKTCPVEESSSSAAVVPQLTAWKVTLSTRVTEQNAVDLDARKTYLVSDREVNAASIDLYLDRKNREAVLFTNASLGAASASKIGEEDKSGLNYAIAPASATMNEFRYNENKLADAQNDINDYEMITSYVVITPEFDASTGKGFFVVLPASPTNIGTSDYSIDLIVLGNWD